MAPVPRPTRRDVLGLAAALPLLPWLTAARGDDEPRARRPHVVFVLSDSHRARDVGCYGSTQVSTPHIDGLAAEGLRLATCLATTPQCRPYRASLMTGLLPHHHGMLRNVSERNFAVRGRQWDPGDVPLLARAFADGGYRTGYVGKWHLGEVALDPGRLRFGFEDFWYVGSKPVHDYRSWNYATSADGTVSGEGDDRMAHEVDVLGRFLEQDDERPAFAVLGWGPPHDPHLPPEAFVRRDPVEPPPNATNKASRSYARDTLPGYLGQIDALDHDLGRLIAQLDRLGLGDDTLLVYTSDHGNQLGSHDLLGKEVPYDESTRVPFVARWPGQLPAGAVLDAPVGVADLMPTLLGLCGLQVPAGLDGRDLSAAFRSGRAPPGTEGVLLAAYDTPQVPFPGWRGVRTARHLYARREDGPWILFDVPADPFGLHNLVHEAPELTASLDALTTQLMAAAGDDGSGRG